MSATIEAVDHARRRAVSLRPYQIEALEAIDRSVACGITRPMLSLATGLGKTVTFSAYLARRPGRAPIVVHRDELVRQSVSTLRRVWPEARVGVVKGNLDFYRAPVVVASVQSLHERRLRRWRPGHFSTIVVDEAHHGTAAQYRSVLAHLDAPVVVGVTATPYRGDRVGLGEVFDEVVFAMGLAEGIAGGFLADVRGWRVRTEVSLDKVRTRGDDFVESDLAKVVNLERRNQAVVEAYLRLSPSKRAVVFAAGVAHATDLAEAFRKARVPSAVVSGKTPGHERREILADLRRGKIRVVTSCGVLTEGFDEPSVEVIAIARPTRSLGLFTQMVGRGTRLYPAGAKSEVTLIDAVDVTRRYRIVGISDLVGTKAKIGAGQSISEVTGHDKSRSFVALRRLDLDLSSGELSIEEVTDLVERFESCGPYPSFDWREVESITRRDGEGDALPATERQVKRLVEYGWPQHGAEGLGTRAASRAIGRLDAAVSRWVDARAHAWAMMLGIEVEVARSLVGDAGWKRPPATRAQLEAMSRWGIAFLPGGVSKGEASMLIEARSLRARSDSQDGTARRGLVVGRRAGSGEYGS